MLKYIGIFTVVLFAVTVSGEYSRYVKKRLAECEAFLAFISHMRIQIGCFLRPVRELRHGLKAEALEKVGFFDALCELDNIYEAFMRCKVNLSLSKEETAVLEKLFLSIGEGYLDDELKFIDSAYSDMESLCARLRTEGAKNVKLFSAVSVTAALGFVIFLI